MLRLAFLLATFFFPKDVLLAPTMIFGGMVSVVAPSDSLPAFPEAEGWGALALNACRSSTVVVHRVTNTNDSGAGSFRTAIDAVSGGNFDIIVFTTGGTVDLASRLNLDAGCVYIAGQTAPGGGFQAKDGGMRLFNNDDVVIRYIRVRHGFVGTCGGCGAIRLSDTGGANRIIMDHTSQGWTADGTIGVWRTLNTSPHTTHITLSRNLVHEGL